MAANVAVDAVCSGQSFDTDGDFLSSFVRKVGCRICRRRHSARNPRYLQCLRDVCGRSIGLRIKRYFFDTGVKCCTISSDASNFLVGRILLDKDRPPKLV